MDELLIRATEASDNANAKFARNQKLTHAEYDNLIECHSAVADAALAAGEILLWLITDMTISNLIEDRESIVEETKQDEEH